MIVGRHTKDSNAVLPYSVQLANWLASLTGETSIASCAWSIEDAPDAVLTATSPTLTGTMATVRVSGGTVGETYRVRCRATTAPNAYVDDFVHIIMIAEH
jgi:hypothetical protein